MESKNNFDQQTLEKIYLQFVREINAESKEDCKWALAMAWNVLYGTIISDEALDRLLLDFGDEQTISSLVEETATEILEAFGE